MLVRFTYKGNPGVRLRFSFVCWCGRNMHQLRGDKEGWYCRKHGLQSFEIGFSADAVAKKN